MRVLAIDGALGGFSVAYIDDDRRIADRSVGNDALETGIGRIAIVLQEAGVTLAACDRIAVGTGPGGFTGLRIAVAYAKSLALGVGRPLVGISSYDALTPDAAPLPLLTVVSGRTGIICARLRATGGEATACGRIADVLETLLANIQGNVITLAGMTEDVRDAIAERGMTVRTLPPRADIPAVAIAELARLREPASSVHALRPDYGELPAVTVPGGAR